MSERIEQIDNIFIPSSGVVVVDSSNSEGYESPEKKKRGRPKIEKPPGKPGRPKKYFTDEERHKAQHEQKMRHQHVPENLEKKRRRDMLRYYRNKEKKKEEANAS